MGLATSKGNEAKSKTKQPSDIIGKGKQEKRYPVSQVFMLKIIKKLHQNGCTQFMSHRNIT